MIFPKLLIEEIVQEKDRTRLDATRSYVSSGSDAIASVTFTPGKDGTPIVVTSATARNWVLDFQFDFLLDVDSTNNKLDFSEGGSELTATVADGNYTLTALAAAIKTALDAAGALTYTVTVDSLDRFVITAPSAFEILSVTGTNVGGTSLWEEIGFPTRPTAIFVEPFIPEDQTGKATYTGQEVEDVNKLITLLVTDTGAGTESITQTLKIRSERADRLFSSDDMLRKHEPDILKYIVAGRDSFKDQHRLAQTQIFDWMDKEGFVDIYSQKFTKHNAVIPDEFRQWSKFLTLRLIYDGVSNKDDDIFFKKARQYEAKEKFYRDRAVLRLDIDGDDDAEISEQIDTGTATLFRR